MPYRMPMLPTQPPNQLECMRMYDLYYPQVPQQQFQKLSQISPTITTPSQTPVQPTTNTPTTNYIQTPSTTTTTPPTTALPAIRQPTDLFGNPITPTQLPQKSRRQLDFHSNNPRLKQISNQKIRTHISRNLVIGIIAQEER